MNSVLVSYRAIPQSSNWATGDFVVRALRALGHEAHSYAKYYNENRWVEDPRGLLDREYSLYIQMECGDGDVFYSELRNVKAAKRVSYWFDVSLYPERWKRETDYISSRVNFVANKNYVHTHSNTVFLPYAADELHYRPIIENGSFAGFKNRFGHIEMKAPIFLIIGSDRPNRREMYDALDVAGLSTYYVTSAFREEYVDWLARAEFVINDVAGGGSGLLPMRPFEVLAAGSKLITPRGDGVKELGLPCYEYSDIPSLIDLCRHLKNTPSLYNGKELQNWFMENHTYKERCSRILEIAKL